MVGLEDELDVFLFHLLHALVLSPGGIQEREVRSDPMIEQARQVDLVGLREDHGPLNRVFQLADVAGPFILQQGFPGFWRDLTDGFPCLFVGFEEEVLQEIRDVFPSFAEWREMDGDDAQAVEEVLAELAGLDTFGQVLVGGGNDAHVHRSSLAWMLRLMLLISSRKMVPPSATSKRPCFVS